MNRRVPFLRVAVSAVLAVVVSSRSVAAPPDSRRAADEFFENRIRPVLVERCFSCHGEASKGGLRLDSRAAVLKGGKSGPAAVPGNADAGLLIRALRHTDAKVKMPPAPARPLTAAQVQDFVEWIQLGLPYPDRPARPLDLTAARRFWSLRPIGRAAAPPVRQTDWPRTLPDAFVLAKLEAKGL